MKPSQRRKIDARFALIESELGILRDEFEVGGPLQPIRDKLNASKLQLGDAMKAFKISPLMDKEALMTVMVGDEHNAELSDGLGGRSEQ